MADAGVRNPLQELHLRLQAPAAWANGVIKVSFRGGPVLIVGDVMIPDCLN